MKVGVVGCGAVGSFYGAKLCRDGHRTHFLLRSDYEVVRRQGVRVLSVEGDFHARPVAARRPEEIGPCDWLLIALKTTANDRLGHLALPLVGPHTRVVTLQNGLDNEARLAECVGPEKVLGGLCFVCLNRLRPGVIRHTAHGRITFGEYRRPPGPATRAVVELFEHAGVPCEVAPDLERAHWEKLVWNVPFNGLGVAGAAGYEAVATGRVSAGGTTRRALPTSELLGDPRWARLVEELMGEVIATARALGHAVPEELAGTMIALTRCMGDYRASTLLDFERGQALEIEGLFRAPLRCARQAGVSTPRLAALCAVLERLDPGAVPNPHVPNPHLLFPPARAHSAAEPASGPAVPAGTLAREQTNTTTAMRTTFVTPFTSETARELQRRATSQPAPEPPPKPARSETLLAGFDFGTNSSCLKACYAGASELVTNEIVPSVVGYVKEGIVENLLPGNAKVLFGQQAIKNRLYLRLVPPMVNGVVDDLQAAQDFARHLRGILNPPQGTEVRAVIGIPANADRAAQESMCQAVSGLFDKVLLIPEPFLGALGFRDEGRLEDPSYLDPVRNSLFVDIGAGTTNACLVQGYFPTGEDQVSVAFAGDRVDLALGEAIRKAYSDINLSLVKVREIKEQYSYVGKLDNPVAVSLVIAGKMRRLDLGDAIGKACEPVLQRVFELVKNLIAQASTDSVGELMQNIILTGGGSRIRHIDTELQRLLADDGYEKPRVQLVGEGYKELVAKGGLTAARQAKEGQWQAI